METRDIIMAIVALLGTGGFLGSLRLLYLARPDRQKTEAERKKTEAEREQIMAAVRATTIAQWHELADARQEEIVDLRKRLVVVEACLEDTRAQLRVAQARVWVLETERVSLLGRIDELEGKKQPVEGKP